MIQIQTDRLLLRAPCPDDLDDYLLLNNDPEVVRYVRTTLPPDRDGLKEWIEGLAKRYPPGSKRGVWVAEHEGRFAGSFMLRTARDNGELELGYRLLPGLWCKGLATEACHALLEFAENERVIARARQDNAASIRVMKRLGMTLAREYEFEHKSCVEYAFNVEI